MIALVLIINILLMCRLCEGKHCVQFICVQFICVLLLKVMLVFLKIKVLRRAKSYVWQWL